MREQFVAAGGAGVHCFSVAFDASTLSWENFRSDIIGATDPTRAAPGSLRADILEQWRALGLPARPSMAANGVHASAGPLEGLKERLIWLHGDLAFAHQAIAADPFGAKLLATGVAAGDLATLLSGNPFVSPPDGSAPEKIFDLTEGMDSAAVLALAPRLSLA